MPTQQIWTHGNAGLMEVPGAPGINNKTEIENAFYLFQTSWTRDGLFFTGGSDMVDLRGWGTAAFVRMGFEGRVVVWDRGRGDVDKSGGFWLQYALPTIVTPGARVKKVMVRSKPDNQDKITITRIHMWDGNRRRVFADDSVRDPSDFEGSLNQNYEMGLTVSLFVKATRANDDILRIFSVGAEVDL